MSVRRTGGDLAGGRAVYTTADHEAVLHVEEVSNGGIDSGYSDIVIPPGEVRGLAGTAGGFANAILWVTKLEMPADVTVEGRLEFFHEDCRSPPPRNRAAARLALPIFRSLVPAGVRTLHAGTDLGIQNVRTNVSVYNAGSVTATATIEIHNACLCHHPAARDARREHPSRHFAPDACV